MNSQSPDCSRLWFVHRQQQYYDFCGSDTFVRWTDTKMNRWIESL